MSDVVLTLEGLTKTYNAGQPGEVQVLAGVDLKIAGGEMVALVAPSGAGKSTLLHMAGLLDTPGAGRVLFGDRDMTGLNDHARTLARREEVGFVYQLHHLLPEFSALVNILSIITFLPLERNASRVPTIATVDNSFILCE